MMTLRGAKGHDAPNQDRSVVLQHSVASFDDDINANNNINNNNNNNDWTMLAALFDGHGELGHVASQIAIHELPLHLAAAAKNIQSGDNNNNNGLQQEVQQLFTSAYLELDNGPLADIPRAGTTAVTVLQQGHRVHLASAGDSTAVLVQWLGGGGVQNDPRPWYYRQWFSFLGRRRRSNTLTTTSTTSAAAGQRRPPYQILARAVQHKPGDPRERARIEAAGGVVHIPFDASQTSRVVYPVHDDATGFTMQMALAMSRSLGDRDGKQLGVVIADPDVVTVDLNDHMSVDHHQGFFVVLASDGVADMVPIEDVIVSLGMALYNEGDDLHTAVQDILTTSVERWGAATGHMYRDDMSLIVQTIELPSG